VNDLVLSHKGALKCIKPRVKLQGRPAFIAHQCTAGFSINISEEIACAGTHYTATVYISQTCRSCSQGRVRAHKLGVVGNTIHVLLQISSGMLLPKIMKIGSRIKKLLQK